VNSLLSSFCALALATPVLLASPLPVDLPKLGTASQSATLGDHHAGLALDGKPSTTARTENTPGSYWQIHLHRPLRTQAVEITAAEDPELAAALEGALVTYSNLEGQVLLTHAIQGIGPGETWRSPGLEHAWIRSIRIALPEAQPNGAGRHDIALAAFRWMGDPSPTSGPIALPYAAVCSQSSTAGYGEAGLAIDGHAGTICETEDLEGSFWSLALERPRRVDRIEILNRNDGFSARLGGLTLALLAPDGGQIHETEISDPGPGGLWSYELPEEIESLGGIRLSLPPGQTNDHGDQVISLADLSLFVGHNVALGTESYMVRLHDALPPAGLANDGDFLTFTETSNRTVDGYWETDFGADRLLHSVRVVALDSGTNRQRLAKATLRLYDDRHESIHSTPLSNHVQGLSGNFDIVLPEGIRARYLRVGLENKERTLGLEWYLRLREVQAFSPVTEPPPALSFHAAENSTPSGQATELHWRQNGMHSLMLLPGHGSVGGLTAADGSGSTAVHPATSTEYTLIAEAPGQRQIRHATVLVDDQPIPLFFSEICASNQNSLRDGYDESPDWIEISNPNPFAWDVSGYGLSDNPSAPMKWIFPADTRIPANGTLLVMASGRDGGPDPKGWLHTNFSLSAGGESVLLTAPDGNAPLAALPTYPPQKTDLSYGFRSPTDGPAFQQPTPGVRDPSAPSYSGWLAAPEFSHARGFHHETFTLALSNPNPAGTLYYSLDGSEPSTPYTQPLPIHSSTVVRAAVRGDDWLDSDLATHSYLFVDSVMASPLMRATYTTGPLAERLRASFGQIPTLSLSVATVPNDRIERETSVEIFMPDGSEPVQIQAGLNRMGGSWTTFAKNSYRLKFRSQYGPSRLESTLLDGFDRGIPVKRDIKTLQLHGGNQDMQGAGFYMSGRFVDDTMLEMGQLNPHGRYVHLFINGVYWGQYDAHERLEDAFLATYLGGERRDYVNVLGNDNIDWTFVPGTPEPPHRETWESARAQRHSYEALRQLVDIPNLIDFMILWLYGHAESEFRAAGPIAAGGSGFKFWMNDADGFLRTSALEKNSTNNQGPGFLFGGLANEQHPDFMMLLADHIHRHCHHNGALTPGRNLARLNRRMAEVQDSMIAEFARWGYRTPANWNAAADAIRDQLFPRRTMQLVDNFRNRGFYPAAEAPVFASRRAAQGAEADLAVNAVKGALLYTVDGSDPRLPGGAVSASALSLALPAKSWIPTGAVWSYDDGPVLPSDDWKEPDFEDANWKTGKAPLGYGGGQATALSFGADANQKPLRARFRKDFQVPNPAEIEWLALDIAYDDGAVVYLNGHEILRTNLPNGPLLPDSRAWNDVLANAKLRLHPHLLPANHLLAGRNVLAVEIFQVTPASTDLYFHLALGPAPQLTVPLETTIHMRNLDAGTWSARSEASARDVHPLAARPYVFSNWPATQPAKTYPPSMRFMQTASPDPTLIDTMEAPWELAYNLTSRSRMVGLGTHGISFVNTGNAQDLPGAGYVGSAVLSLDSRGAQNIQVSWTAGTVVPNQREQGLRLQYRRTGTAAFADVPDSAGQPVEYLRHPSAGHEERIGPVTLPTDAEDLEQLELRWVYHHLGGASGARAQLRLDDIVITRDGPALHYEDWRLRQFPHLPPDDPAGLTAPEFLSDGWSHLLRYAFNVDLGQDPSPSFPSITENGRLRFVMFPEKTDIVYRLRVSDDLMDWSYVEYDSSLDPLPPKINGRYELPIGVHGPGKRFYRVEITR
jgi:hypothetical protein